VDNPRGDLFPKEETLPLNVFMPLLSKLDYKTCKKLANKRMAEAKCLLGSRHYSGAYYLSGYAIEMGLKALYCKSVKRGSFPPRRMYIVAYTITSSMAFFLLVDLNPNTMQK